MVTASSTFDTSTSGAGAELAEKGALLTPVTPRVPTSAPPLVLRLGAAHHSLVHS